MFFNHNPITLDKLIFTHLHKMLFDQFSTIIHPGDRIALLGPNGTGKTTLLKILAGELEPTSGAISGIVGIQVGYLQQNQPFDEHKTVWQCATEGTDNCDEGEGLPVLHHIEKLISQAGFADRKHELVRTLSGGERVRLALVHAMAQNPTLLLLDEPTNHLDAQNKTKLYSLIHDWPGTALIVTHDTELLRTWPTKLWHLEHGTMTVFNGGYDDFLQEREWDKERSVAEAERLKREQKQLKNAEMKYLQKAAKGKRNAKNALLKGSINRLAFNGMKENAEKSSGAIRRDVESRRSALKDQLAAITIYEELKPSFHMEPLTHKNAALFIRDGTVSYGTRTILENLHINIQPGERYAIIGDNGSGKSTLFKAILADNTVERGGSWNCPLQGMIGYIDQHYSLLEPHLKALEIIKLVRPEWDDRMIRKHLNDFLFRTPEEVATPTSSLSGGERARLAIASIAAQGPSMLLLDEITNNLDRLAREHVIKALLEFPGTLLVISHDEDFLEAIGITELIHISQGTHSARSHRA